jgi:4-amino-4-deoxy-L-arabinose transferase-like glycosyltransferase
MHAPAAIVGWRSATLHTRALVVAILIIAVMAAARAAFAALVELRTDEAYYWTWSKEDVLSFLDHPPMIAWFVRAGTAVFGDTPFGARAGGLLALAGTQLLLADIVRRRTHGLAPMLFALLAPEAAAYYSLMMVLVAPDVPLVVFLTAMLWALIRLDESRDPRWWLLAGACGGLALLSKYTAVMFVPAILAFMLVPPKNRLWLLTPWPWLAGAVAVLVFSPVLIWNAQHHWASFAFQFVRLTAERPWSLAWFGDFVGLQWGLVGPLLFPLVVAGTAMAAWDGYRSKDGARILLATAAAVPFVYFLWRSGWMRISVTWPMVLWPPAFAAAALTLDDLRRRKHQWVRLLTRAAFLAIGGAGLVLLILAYYVIPGPLPLGKLDPIGQEAGYEEVARKAVELMENTGATWIATTEYRTYAMLRWHFKDRIPVVQINERSRFVGFDQEKLRRLDPQSALYVTPRGRIPTELWARMGVQRRTVGMARRTWRGRRLTKFYFQQTTGWRADFTPASGTLLYGATPYFPAGPRILCKGVRCRAPI